MRRLAFLVPCLLLALPGSAQAAKVSLGGPAGDYFDGPNLDYTAGAGEANGVTLSVASDHGVTVRDAGAPLTEGSGCAKVDAHTARCSTATGSPTIESASVSLGDRDDRATLSVPRAAGWGALGVDGGPGADAVDASAVIDVVDPKEEFGALSVDGGTGDDHLIGGPGHDTLTGGRGADRLEGGPGADTLDGDGAAGGPFGSDRLDGGRGSDTVTYEPRRRGVRVDLAGHRGGGSGERDSLRSIENVIGGNGRDVLEGDGRANELEGSGVLFQHRGSGDRLVGRGGNDTLLDFGGASRLDGGPGRDEVAGVNARDRVRCGRGRDRISEFNRVLMAPDCERMDTQSYRYSRLVVHGGSARIRTGLVPDAGRCKVRLTLRSRGGRLYGRTRFHGRRRLRIRLTRAGRRAASLHRVASVDAFERCADTHDRWRVRF
jgi:Ca2+-binding RTX toxin-like protein